jgi:hypothetical protein
LIEEKIGIGFAGRLSGHTLRPLRKRWARCEKYFTPRRNETATFATPLFNRGPAGYQKLYGAITIFQRSRVLKLFLMPETLWL